MKTTWFLLLLAATLELAPSPAGAEPIPAPEPVQQQRRDERRVTLRVEGMRCGHCATSLADGLRQVDGVLEARVSYDEHRAWVRYDAARITLERLIEAVEELGYRAEIESES